MDDIVTVKLPWPEPRLPKYHRGSFGPWSLEPTPVLYNTAGYFLPALRQPSGWVIKHEGKNVWMSLARMEVESHMPHLAAARGRVVVMGLGMGFALYNVMQKHDVTSVVVVEQNPDIVELLNNTTCWRQWPGHEKVSLVMDDALRYKPAGEVDFLYADIWPRVGNDDALRHTQIMQDNVQAELVGFWGQEFDYVDWLCQTSAPHNQASYRRFAREARLPLIEQNHPRYTQLALAAVTLQIGAGERDKIRKQKILCRYFEFLTAEPEDLIAHAIRTI